MKKPYFLKMIVSFSFIFVFVIGYAQPKISIIGKYLCLDYKPFFPIGLYSFPDKRSDDAMWKEAADAGFNFLNSKESGRHGIYVAKAIPWKQLNGLNVSTMELYRDPSLLVDLKKFLAENENDSTMICWHAPDEPSWFGPSALSLQLGYQAIKDNSVKPVWLNIGPAFAKEGINYNMPSELINSLDILSEDIYPIPDDKPKASQGGNRWAYYVGQDTKNLVDLCSINGAQIKPVWMVLQGFNWADIGSPADYKSPTMHELRFMTYDAIVHGATGILWWGLRSTKTPAQAQLWNDLKSMASELREYYSLWTCPFELFNSKLVVGDTTVHTLIKLLNDKVYVLAVNTRNVPLKNVKFSVSENGGKVTKVNVLEENRQVKLTDKTSWTDNFDGYGVHIYETDIYFSFMRRYYKDPEAKK